MKTISTTAKPNAPTLSWVMYWKPLEIIGQPHQAPKGGSRTGTLPGERGSGTSASIQPTTSQRKKAMDNDSRKLQTHSADATAITVRQLSTEQQNAWIERVFAKLTAIYGDAFTRNWIESDFDDVKRTWSDILGGFSADDIGAALKQCYAMPKPPNAPEFASMCRTHMTTRTKPIESPLTPEERAAARKVADTVAASLKAKETKAKGYRVNGVLITIYKQWAVDLVKREAAGEMLPQISKESWREVLGYPRDIDAKKVLEGMA